MFTSWAVWWAFFQIWLTSDSGGLMLDGAEVGTIFAINGAATVGFQLIYGTLQDRLGLRRHLLIAMGGIASLLGPFVTWVYQPLLVSHFYLGAVLGSLVFAGGFSAAVGLGEAYFDRLSRTHHFTFGRARLFGSLGYAIAVLIAGFVYTLHPLSIFWVASILGVALVVIHLLWTVESVDEPEGGTSTLGSDVALLIRNRQLWALMLVVLLSWTVYQIFEAQMFPDFYASQFASVEEGQQLFGVLAAVQTCAEAVVMGLVPIVMTKIGVKPTIMLGAMVMVIPVAGSAFSDMPLIISVTKLAHAAMVPLIVLGILRYVTLHFNNALSATVYLFGFYVTTFLGSVVLSRPLGMLRDAVGYQTTFMVMTAVIASSVVAAFVVLRRDSAAIDESGSRMR